MQVPPFEPLEDSPGVDRTVFDSPQGQWSYSSTAAPAELADVVSAFWETHGFADYSREKILPRGTVEVIINLGPPHKTLDGANLATIDTFRSAWISGLHERALIAAPTYDTAELGSLLVGASLTAHGAYSLFGVSGRFLTNEVLELSELISETQIEVLREQLFEACDTRSRFSAFAGLLLQQRRRAGRDTSSTVAWSLRTLAQSSGMARVEGLCEMCGVSRKHLAARFRGEVGVSPKRYARILRFAGLIKRLETCAKPNWTELALLCGYYDQAHLVREFRAFSGESPTEFVRARSPDGRSILYD